MLHYGTREIVHRARLNIYFAVHDTFAESGLGKRKNAVYESLLILVFTSHIYI